jgi:ABC-type tungstate transport system substrate-binding protein
MRRLRSMPRRTRRLIVLGTFVAYPLVYVGYALLSRSGALPPVSLLWTPIAIVLMFGFALGLFAIYGITRNRAEPESIELDERQRDLAVRARAYSYGVLLTFIVAIAGLWAVYVTTIGPVTLGPELLLPVAIVVGVYLPVLPSAVLAWIEPDAPPEDVAGANGTTSQVGGAAG